MHQEQQNKRSATQVRLMAHRAQDPIFGSGSSADALEGEDMYNVLSAPSPIMPPPDIHHHLDVQGYLPD